MARNPKLILDIQANVKQIQSTLSGLDNKIDGFGKNVKKGTETASAGFAQFGLAVQGVQSAFAILDGTVGKVFRNVAEIGGEFEFQFDKVRGILGETATAGDLQKLEEQAIALGSSTMKSASEVAGLQFELSKLGFNAEEIDNATASIVNMGIAFDAELSQVAEVAGGTLRAFNLETTETARVADVMAKSFSVSALDIDKFTNSMTYVAPVASQAGVSLEETTAMLGFLANRSISGSMAGTALRSIFQQLADSGSDLAKKIGRPVMGFEDMISAFQDLQAEGNDLTDVLSFMDRRTAGVFANMIDNTETIELMKESLEGAEGASEKLAKIMADNLRGDMVALESATEGFWIKVHKELDPALRGLTQTMTKFVGQIDAEEIKAYATGISAVALATTGWAFATGKLTKALKILKIAMVKTGIGALVVGIGLAIGAILDWMDVFDDNTDSIDENTEALEANKRKAEELANFRKNISTIDDPEELQRMIDKRQALVDKIQSEKDNWEDVAKRVQKYKKELVKAGEIEKGAELTTDNWDAILERQQRFINKARQRIVDIQNGDKMQGKSDEEKLAKIEQIEGKIAEELTTQDLLIVAYGEQVDEIKNKNAEAVKANEPIKDELKLLDNAIKKKEHQIKIEKQRTKTSEEHLELIKKIADLEQKQDEIVFKNYEKFVLMKDRIDGDAFDKKVFRLEDALKREIDSIDKGKELNQKSINALTKMRDEDKTLTDADRVKIQQDIDESVLKRTEAERYKAEITKFYAEEVKKVETERLEHEEDVNNETVAKRYAMGLEVSGTDQMQFNNYMSFLDERLKSEEAYSDEWFALLQHREDTFDDHINALNENKYSGFQESLRLLNEEANAEETSAERKKEIQDRMADITMERLGRLRLGFKEFLKGEILDFLTAQQIKLFGKLAEILATGATTLGTSLAVSLPLYGAGIAMLEVAKNKVSAFAKGGVIDKPTMALMGEAGTEVVIPEKGFKDYVREQIVPFQNDLISQNLSPYNISQNFNQNLNQERMETLTALNTTAIQEMRNELGTVRQALMLPQSMTISDGNTFASGKVSRGSL